MDRRAGPEFCPPDLDPGKERGKEIKQLHHRLAQFFHPDIDGANKSASEWQRDNEMLAKVNALVEQAEAGDDSALQELNALYREYVLKEEAIETEEAGKTAADLKPHLERLQARFRAYLLAEEGEEFQTFVEEWNKEWQALSEEDRERLRIVSDIHQSFLALREKLKSYAEFKNFSTQKQQEYANLVIAAIAEKISETMEQFENDNEPLDPVALVGSLSSLMQQVAAQIKVMADEMKPVEGESKEKKEEERKAVDPEEDFAAHDDDDDDEEEAVASTTARPAPVQPQAEEKEGEDDLLPALLALGAYGLSKTEDGKTVVVPADNNHREHLAELKQNDFIEGEWRGGVFLVHRQVLPWGVAPRGGFLLTNLRYYGLFPRAFRHLQRPGTEEYFPEAAFLDTTGRALAEYVNGRWEAYLRSPEYRAYLNEFDSDS